MDKSEWRRHFEWIICIFLWNKNSFFARESLGFQIKFWHRKYNFDHCTVIIFVHNFWSQHPTGPSVLIDLVPIWNFQRTPNCLYLKFKNDQPKVKWKSKINNSVCWIVQPSFKVFEQQQPCRFEFGNSITYITIEWTSLKVKQCQTNRAHKGPAGFGVFWRRYKRMKISVESKFV